MLYQKSIKIEFQGHFGRTSSCVRSLKTSQVYALTVKINILRFEPELFGGVPKNFDRVCCSIGPQQVMLYCIFKKEFLKIWGLYCSMGLIFFRKICQKFDRFSKIFSKNQCFTLRNGLKWEDFEEF